MVLRSSAGNSRLLKDQYDLLKDALDSYYAGLEARAIDIAVRIRTLVHQTAKSEAFLLAIDSNYQTLNIYHRRPAGPNTVFKMMQGISFSGDGTKRIIRDNFTKGFHDLVPLERWWTEPYLKIGQTIHSSKRDIVLDISNKDGGAHVDPKGVPSRHAVASEPPFVFGVNGSFVTPNLARSTVAQAGNELLDYLERHFASHLAV